MQKCEFNKVALHRLLLKTWTLVPVSRPRKTWTLKNLAHEKRGKQLDAKKKKIGRPLSIIYYNT